MFKACAIASNDADTASFRPSETRQQDDSPQAATNNRSNKHTNLANNATHFVKLSLGNVATPYVFGTFWLHDRGVCSDKISAAG